MNASDILATFQRRQRHKIEKQFSGASGPLSDPRALGLLLVFHDRLHDDQWVRLYFDLSFGEFTEMVESAADIAELQAAIDQRCPDYFIRLDDCK